VLNAKKWSLLALSWLSADSLNADCPKSAYKPKPPFRAVLASWVELLNSQAGGGHNYEDVRCIFTRTLWWDNTAK
jgi:hypothetical protein